MDTLVEELSNCCDYFSSLSGFSNLSGKLFLITFKFSELDYSVMFCKSNVNKTVWLFKFREIIAAKSLKSKKKKLLLTLCYFVSQEIWLGNSKGFVCVDQSRFYIFSHPQKFKKIIITSKYLSFFDNKPSAGWLAYMARDFLTCYSCL